MILQLCVKRLASAILPDDVEHISHKHYRGVHIFHSVFSLIILIFVPDLLTALVPAPMFLLSFSVLESLLVPGKTCVQPEAARGSQVTGPHAETSHFCPVPKASSARLPIWDFSLRETLPASK